MVARKPKAKPCPLTPQKGSYDTTREMCMICMEERSEIIIITCDLIQKYIYNPTVEEPMKVDVFFYGLGDGYGLASGTEKVAQVDRRKDLGKFCKVMFTTLKQSVK